MKDLLKIAGLPVLGLVTVTAGFVYEVMFAGIPYQDPTPELQSRWEFHKSIAGTFYWIGGIVLVGGITAVPVIWIWIRRNTSPCNRL